MKRNNIILGFIIPLSLTLASCTLVNTISDNYLKITELPTTTKYVVGDAFNHLGLEVVDKDDKKVTDYNLSIADGTILNEVGEFEVTVSKVQYKSTSFNIKVRENSAPDIEALNRAKESAREELNEYYDSFDLDEYDSSGRDLLLNIKNQAIDDINKSTSISAVNNLLNTAKEDLNAVEKKEIDPGKTIKELNCTPPYNLRYIVGENIDLTGLVVFIVYTDDTEEEVVNYQVGDVDMSSAGNKRVEISYKGFTTYFDIEVIEKTTERYSSIEIYATNDIHGQVAEEYNRAGVKKTFTYLKNNDGENTLLLDQGDTWQGSVYSNSNRGKMITEMMNYVHYDARTIGNHDFDWGQEPLKYNKNITYGDYQMPTLCANVYNYNFETKVVGSTFQSSLANKTISYTLENGLKVGIVGVIGEEQITSIMSKHVENVAFTNHVDVIKTESTRLKEEGCDVVIATVHAGQESVINCGLSEYVDLVLCGHTHIYQTYEENNLYYGQFGSYTSGIGHITLTYDNEIKDVSKTEINYIEATEISNNTATIDTTIQAIADKYYDQLDEDPNEVVASNVYGYFSKTVELPNAMCAAIFNQCKKENIDVDLAFCNEARYNLNKSSWNFSDIYQAFPFDNEIYIIEASYSEMMNEISKWNNVYRSPNFDGVVNNSRKYRVACIDFLAYHTNSNRYYDFFPDNNGRYVDKLSITYRQIFRNWLVDEGYKSGVSLNSAYFSSSLTPFSRIFYTSTSKVKFMMNDGTNNVYKDLYINIGDEITKYYPAKNPIREGYNFNGWYLEQECNNNASGRAVSGDEFVLYAGWIENGSSSDKGTSIDNPFTVSEAISHINNHGNDGNVYFVRGIVVDGSVSKSSYSDDSYRFNITDGLATFTAYYVYTGSIVPNAGDEVIISGQLVLYNGSIYETVNGTGRLETVL